MAPTTSGSPASASTTLTRASVTRCTTARIAVDV
jgi:hypothetical protein